MMNDKLITKSISFHKDNDEEMRVYRILERKRYKQSELIIKLLFDFFKKFDLNESTPYDDFCFTISAYLENGQIENQHKYRVMQILRKDSENTGYPYSDDLQS